MSKVLVTGGAGYLGSTLVPALLDRGFAVTVVDNFMYGQDSLAAVCYQPEFSLVRGDVRSIEHDAAARQRRRHHHSARRAGRARRSAIAIRSRPRRPTRTPSSTCSAWLSRDQRVLLPITNSGYGVGEAGQVLHRGDADPADLALRPRQGRGRAHAARAPSGRHQLPPGDRLRHVAAHAARSAGQRLHLSRVHRSLHRAVRKPLQAQLTSTSATWRARFCTASITSTR